MVPDDHKHKEDLVEGAEVALPQLEDAGIEVILTGHLHVPFNSDMGFRTPDRKIVSVHAGTCMSTRLRGEPNSYNRLVFEGNRLTITLRLWDGTRFGDGDTKVYERRGVNGPNEQFARLQ